MADPYRYHGSLNQSHQQRNDNSGDSPKPQLPNFDHFVRSAGHPGLAQRNARQDSIRRTLTPLGHGSLPTPPLNPSNRSFWEGGVQAQPQSHQPSWSVEHSHSHSHSHSLERTERPSLAPELHRRASFALPIQAQPQARPARAYSSTNPDRSYHDLVGGPYDQVQGQGLAIQEDDCSDHRAEYVDEGDDGVSREVHGDSGSSVWGTTKAGKPRKRLSQACSTCREKKIKCDPGGGRKCSQCLRFNRECKFDKNSRQGHKSSKFRPSTHSSSLSPGATNSTSNVNIVHSLQLQDHPSSNSSPMAPSDVPPLPDAAQRTASLSSTSADEVLSPTMSDRLSTDAPTPSKRQRLSPEYPDRPNNSSRNDALRRNSHLGYSVEIDPIVANDKLTRHYMELFMECINIPTFEVFPRSRMLQWVYTETKKTMHDRIAVYAMLALATVHSNDPQRSVHRALFKSIVHSQLDQLESAYSLQVAHTFLFIAFAEFADSQLQKGYSLFVRTFGCIAFLRLNVEDEDREGMKAYNFSPTMSAECRRRTFWAAYVTDIYAGLSKGDPRIMHGADIYLKLPCASELYEDDDIPDLPVFDQENVLTGIPSSEQLAKMADMVHLIQIGTICSEVQLNAWRGRNALKINRQHLLDRSVRQKLNERLDGWARTYNAGLRAKESGGGNSDLYTESKDSGARAKRYAGLDFLFHYAHMELNRRVYHKTLDNEEMLSYAKTANVHALETLKLTQQLLNQGGSHTKDYYFAVRGPLGGYAVHTALDIITAAGSITDILAPKSQIMTLMWGGCELLEHLSAWWGSAHIQHLQAKERTQSVFNLCQAALYDQKTYFYCTDSMNGETTGRDFDTIYGMDRVQYLRGAYGLSKVRNSEIFVIDTKKKQQSLVVA